MKHHAAAIITALLPLACAGSGSAGGTAPGDLSGTVTVAGGAPLPADAVISLRLDDVSRADAPSDLLAELEIPAGGRQPPVAFHLAYDPDDIQPGHTYRISARVTSEGRLVMISTRAYDVITRGPANGVQVEVEPLNFVAQPAEPVAMPLERTTWVLRELAGESVPLPEDQPGTLLLIPSAGRLAAYAGCNRLAGSYTLDGGQLRLGPLAGTRMACPEPQAGIEQRFIQALGSVSGYRISGDQLDLTDGSRTVARFTAGSPAP